MPSSVVSRPLEGEAPTIEVAVGYSKSNTSPILKLVPVTPRRTVAPEPEALTPRIRLRGYRGWTASTKEVIYGRAFECVGLE